MLDPADRPYIALRIDRAGTGDSVPFAQIPGRELIIYFHGEHKPGRRSADISIHKADIFALFLRFDLLHRPDNDAKARFYSVGRRILDLNQLHLLRHFFAAPLQHNRYLITDFAGGQQ
ncbi:hypothetical protein D3C73_1211940 [compost metagenome]